jgi:threonine/homoserine/homoserine lactone efflux protein
MPTQHLLPFLLTGLLVLVVPGPNVLFVVGRALAYGKGTAITSAAGGAAGAYVQVILVSVGLGSLIERSELVFTAVKLIGAAYLVFLGVKAIRDRHALRQSLADGGGDAPDAPVGVRAVVQGMLVGLTNPKGTVFFGAVLPQFVDPSLGHVPAQMIMLATAFCVMGVLSDCTWGLIAGTARDWFARSPRRLALVGGAGGLAMIGLGVGIAVTGRED